MIEVHEPIEAAGVPTGSSIRPDLVRVPVPWGDLDAACLGQILDQTAPGARIHLSVEVPTDAEDRAGSGAGWPGAEEVGALLATGVTGVTLRHAGAVSPAASVHLVAFLAEAISQGLPVTWDLETPAGTAAAAAARAGAEWSGAELWPFTVDVGDLVHLPPPTGSGPRAREWQDRHAYGLLCWRHGGSFASVTDLRDLDRARYTIDDEELLHLFTSLHRPLRVEDLQAADREQLDVLSEARLVYRCAGWAARLPFRLLRWPMPLDGIG